MTIRNIITIHKCSFLFSIFILLDTIKKKRSDEKNEKICLEYLFFVSYLNLSFFCRVAGLRKMSTHTHANDYLI